MNKFSINKNNETNKKTILIEYDAGYIWEDYIGESLSNFIISKKIDSLKAICWKGSKSA